MQDAKTGSNRWVPDIREDEITEFQEQNGEQTATYKAVNVHPIISRVLDKLAFFRTHVSAVWYNKLANKTVKDKLDEIDTSIEALDTKSVTVSCVYDGSTSKYTHFLTVDFSQPFGLNEKAYLVTGLNDFCIIKFKITTDGTIYFGIGAQGIFMNSANFRCTRRTGESGAKFFDIYVARSYNNMETITIQEIFSRIPEGYTDRFTFVENGAMYTLSELSENYETVSQPTSSRLDRYYKMNKSYTDMSTTTGDTFANSTVSNGSTKNILRSIRVYASNYITSGLFYVASENEYNINFSAVLIDTTTGKNYPLPYFNIDSDGTVLGQVLLKIEDMDSPYAGYQCGRIKTIGTHGITLANCILFVDRQFIEIT